MNPTFSFTAPPLPPGGFRFNSNVASTTNDEQRQPNFLGVVLGNTQAPLGSTQERMNERMKGLQTFYESSTKKLESGGAPLVHEVSTMFFADATKMLGHTPHEKLYLTFGGQGRLDQQDKEYKDAFKWVCIELENQLVRLLSSANSNSTIATGRNDDDDSKPPAKPSALTGDPTMAAIEQRFPTTQMTSLATAAAAAAAGGGASVASPTTISTPTAKRSAEDMAFEAFAGPFASAIKIGRIPLDQLTPEAFQKLQRMATENRKDAASKVKAAEDRRTDELLAIQLRDTAAEVAAKQRRDGELQAEKERREMRHRANERHLDDINKRCQEEAQSKTDEFLAVMLSPESQNKKQRQF